MVDIATGQYDMALAVSQDAINTIPSRFLVAPAMSRGPSGKLDRRALAGTGEELRDPGSVVQAGSTTAELPAAVAAEGGRTLGAVPQETDAAASRRVASAGQGGPLAAAGPRRAVDVLLIDPPFFSLRGQEVEAGYSMATVSLAAFLRQKGLDASVLTVDVLSEARADHVDEWNLDQCLAAEAAHASTLRDERHPLWTRIRSEVASCRPAIVGISYRTTAIAAAQRIAAVVKGLDKGIRVIAGGPHATFLPKDVLADPNVDFVVQGEGELPLWRLACDLKAGRGDWASIPGLFWRTADGSVASSPAADLIKDLDTLPQPARDLVLSCDYRKHSVHYVITARGCPYRCAFCSDNRFWRAAVRRRSVDNVLLELESVIRTYAPRYLLFVDGTFTYNRRWLTDFCERLVRAGPKFPWACTARYDNVDEGLLNLMKRAGCFAVYLGFESASDRILAGLDKRMSVDKMIAQSKLFERAGLWTKTSILLGTPVETKEDIELTLAAMRKLDTSLFDVNTYVPLPGTPLWDQMSEDARASIDWSAEVFRAPSRYFSPHVSSEEMRVYLAEAFEIASRRRRTLDEQLSGPGSSKPALAEHRRQGG